MKSLDVVITLVFALFFPLLLHLGVLRGVGFYPRDLTGNPKFNRIFNVAIVYVIAFNGVLVCLSCALWWLWGSEHWFLPLIIGAPSILFQTYFAIGTAFRRAQHIASPEYEELGSE